MQANTAGSAGYHVGSTNQVAKCLGQNVHIIISQDVHRMQHVIRHTALLIFFDMLELNIGLLVQCMSPIADMIRTLIFYSPCKGLSTSQEHLH